MRTQPRYSREEFARRRDEIYERELRTLQETENDGKFVAIDIESGIYEDDANELATSDRLRARVPNAQIWLDPLPLRAPLRLSTPVDTGFDGWLTLL